MRNTVWLTLFVLVGLTWAAPVWAQLCVPPPSGMVSWWPGDGNPNDIVGGNNGTLEGGTTFSPGKVGLAFSLNGVNADVKIPTSSTLNFGPGQSFSIDYWVQSTGPINPLGSYIINKQSFGNSPGYQSAIVPDGRVTFFIADGVANAFLVSTRTILDGAFHHIGLVRDKAAGQTRMYIDGTFENSIPDVTHDLTNNLNLYLGARDPSITRQFFQGLIDEVEIFNRAVTPAEIAAIFAADSAGKCKPGTVRAAYVANAGSNTVSVINPTTNTVVATVPVGQNPVNIAVTPNGASAYVTNAGSNSVSVINTTTNTVVATVAVGINPVNVVLR